ncbi:MAG: hypothetical protein O2782_20335, partial [bacterium]|nr:hypothetical protein [bacterium]
MKRSRPCQDVSEVWRGGLASPARLLVALLLVAGCGVHHAAPSPLATMGPAMAGKGGRTVTGAVGAGREDYGGDGWGASGWHGGG